MNKNKYEYELDFKSLLKNPERLFGWIFPYFLVVIIILGVFYLKNLNYFTINDSSPAITDSTFMIIDRDIPMKKGGIRPAVDLSTIQNPSGEMIEKGKELYSANCASCHGDNGLGDGAAGVALNPKPRNFETKEGWTNGRTFSDMYKTLQEGILQNGMAAYEYIPPEDRVAMINYVRTFSDFPEITDEEVDNLDLTYQLSEGTEIPNQIPVKLAIEKILNEKGISEPKLKSIIIDIFSSNDVEITGLIKDVADDSKRLIYNFAADRAPADFESFKESVFSDPLKWGFNSKVVLLSNDDLELIFNYLNEKTKA
ncbi:MAG: cytochrome c [Melioribacteraceae bacterium]|nr:cytochrome c [Melioribacteraceae bacterium]MCF8354409.1 cytochrome c [Melioribacteraceae bacterium]MCF8392994.1 cytochrome c [Melioribacteraceae bacterium]MCF8417263.1 cytochrome c [Melioribacteraceae bacterium]